MERETEVEQTRGKQQKWDDNNERKTARTVSTKKTTTKVERVRVLGRKTRRWDENTGSGRKTLLDTERTGNNVLVCLKSTYIDS